VTRQVKDVIGLQKAVLWEQAKGQLRAMVAAEGTAAAQYGAGGAYIEPVRWQKLKLRVEAFIAEVENEGLDE